VYYIKLYLFSVKTSEKGRVEFMLVLSLVLLCFSVFLQCVMMVYTFFLFLKAYIPLVQRQFREPTSSGEGDHDTNSIVSSAIFKRPSDYRRMCLNILKVMVLLHVFLLCIFFQ